MALSRFVLSACAPRLLRRKSFFSIPSLIPSLLPPSVVTLFMSSCVVRRSSFVAPPPPKKKVLLVGQRLDTPEGHVRLRQTELFPR